MAKLKSKLDKQIKSVISPRVPKITKRNKDGTFQKGNEGGGRLPEDYSVRGQFKLQAKRNPEIIKNAIKTLVNIANDPNHPKAIDAIDKIIKLNGQYDPTEIKADVQTSIKQSLLTAYSEDELNEALKLKKG
jgi:hypothetical protein